MGVIIVIIVIGCILTMLIAGLVWLIKGLIVGTETLQRGLQHQSEYGWVLRFLGINLCEPFFNTIFVAVLFWHYGMPIYPFYESGFAVLRFTLPMLILLTPLIGLFFQNPLYRAKSAVVLLVGISRWIITALIFLALTRNQTGCIVFLTPAAFGMLWYSVKWCGEQLSGALAFPPLPSSHASFSSSAARPAAPAVITAVAPPAVPLDEAQAIRCPICHAPTMLAWEDCPECGLLFASRVPGALRALPDYVALRPLGDGGMSSVYLARTRATGRLCVLKTLASVDALSAPAWRAEAAECLRREAALLAQIEHPRVARLLDHSGDAGGEFLVLEYIAGPTLEQRLTRTTTHGIVVGGGALLPGAALGYARSVAHTLDYLARLPQPVVHCDIKPANLILPPGAPAPVLVDFGGAQISQASDQTVRLDRYGTPGYAAPEQYAGLATPQSDVYGLAATLYHLLTDDDPGAHPLSFPALAMLPAALAASLGGALAHDPTARPDAAQFGAELARHGG